MSCFTVQRPWYKKLEEQTSMAPALLYLRVEYFDPPAPCLASHQHVHTPLLTNDQFIKDDVLLELCCQGQGSCACFFLTLSRGRRKSSNTEVY